MKQLATILFIFLMSACRTPEDESLIPALVTNSGPETRQELERTVSTALDGARITLAEGALTETSVLVIERGLQRGINRPPELGRDLGQPYRFQLFLAGSTCVLVDQQTEMHWQLATVECAAENQ